MSARTRLGCVVAMALCSLLPCAAAARSPRPTPAGGAPRAPAAATSAATPAPPRAAIARAVARAAAFLAAFPEKDLRFDAAVMLAHVRTAFDGDDLRTAFARARAVADRDDDNPMRRFWIPEFRSPPSVTASWSIPAPGASRVNTNRVVIEALYCADNGLREETVAYLCGPMRDGGGYQSAHALWALEIARSAGCAAALRAEACRVALRAELRGALRPPAGSRRTADVDLFAEQLVVLSTSGTACAEFAPHVARLLALQGEDGSFGSPEAAEPAYFGYHATGLALWALAEWTRGCADAEEGRGARPTSRGGGSR